MIGQLTHAQLTAAIDRAARMGATGYIPVLKAVRAGLIDCVFVNRRDGMVSNRTLKTLQRPVLVIIGDDDHASTGPAGWARTASLMRWAGAAMVHGAGAKPEHYAAAVEGARAHGRFVLIETSSEYVQTWMACAADRVAVAIVPKQGPHPVMPSRGEMH